MPRISMGVIERGPTRIARTHAASERSVTILQVLFACPCNFYEASALHAGRIVLLPFMKRGVETGQYVNIIDERRRGEKVGWPILDVD